MAVTEPQRYPSYVHSTNTSSPHWDNLKPEPCEQKDSHSYTNEATSPNVSRSSVLRQSLLNFSPHGLDQVSPHLKKNTTAHKEQKQSHAQTLSSESEAKNNASVSPVSPAANDADVSKPVVKKRGRRGAKRKEVAEKPTKPLRSLESDSKPVFIGASQQEGNPPTSTRSPKKNVKPDGKRQTQLTAYGIRRTARQFQKEQEREREANVLSLLKTKTESGMKIIYTDDKGRGVVATRPFHEGEFVVEYAGELITEKAAKERESKYRQDATIGSFMFYFVHNGQKYCVDATEETARLGRLINHSRLHPNCIVKVIPLDGVPRLVLFAKQIINPGEELLYDYGDRDKETLEAHPWLKT